MICLIADRINYDDIPRGWYRHGYYSFSLDKTLEAIGIRKSLLKTKIDRDLVEKDLYKEISPYVKELEPKFILKTEKFYHWIHNDIPPEEFKGFYGYSDLFSTELNLLTKRKNIVPKKLFQSISETITNYDINLKHVKREYLDLFFDYSDLLEGLLIVMKKRDLSLSKLHNILDTTVQLYDANIYSTLPPFIQTVKGRDKNEEISKFEDNSEYRFNEAKIGLNVLIDVIQNKNLVPSISDYDEEILHEIKNMEKYQAIPQ